MPDPNSSLTGANQDSSKGVRDYLLLILLLLPLVFYLIHLQGRRDQELLRYHREMISFAEGAQEALQAGTSVIFAATRPEPPFKPQSCSQPVSSAEYTRVRSSPAFVSISQSFYAGLERKPFRPCSINWTGSSDDLTLHFSVDRPSAAVVKSASEVKVTAVVSPQAVEPAVANATRPDPPPHQNETPPPSVASATNPEYRKRFSGQLALHARLAELAGLADFDALLIADQRGELILKLGPSAGLFSSLPILVSSGWDEAVESKPEKRDFGEIFVPTSIAQIERQVAGHEFTLFPREIVLTPTQLLGSPLHCRAGESGEAGQETLRLRAVGLVLSSRLTAKALRPAETSYWFWCLTYLAAWLYILHLYRDRKENTEAPRPSWPHLAVVLGFGLAVGTLLGLLVYCWGLWNWEDSQLRDLAEKFRRSALTQLENARDALREELPSPLVQRFGCVEGKKDGPYRMVRLQTGMREELRPVYQSPLPFLEKPAASLPWIETLISLIDGRKVTLLALREKVRTRTASLELLAAHPASFPAGFGAALIDAPVDAASDWPLLLDSEVARQTSRNFLAEFSNADCVRLKLSDGAGFCSGRFRGHDARIRLEKISSRESSSSQLFDRFLVKGDLVLVTYSYQDLQNSQVEAAALAAIRLDLVFFVLALLACGIACRFKDPPELKSFQRWWDRAQAWLNCRWWQPNWLVHQTGPLLPTAVILGLCMGFLHFGICWLMEDRIYSTITVNAIEDACPKFEQDPSREPTPQDEIEKERVKAVREFLGCAAAPKGKGGWPTDFLYYLVRPSEGRLLRSASRLSAGLVPDLPSPRSSLNIFGSRSTFVRGLPLLAGILVTFTLLLVFLDSRWDPPRPLIKTEGKWLGTGAVIFAALALLVSLVYFEKLALSVFTALSSLGILKTDLLNRFGLSGDKTPGEKK